MGFFNKMKTLGEIAVTKTKEATQTIQQQYQENGMEGVGKVLGTSTKKLIESSKEYVDEIQKDNKKASRPIGITYKKGDPTKDVAQVAIEAINTIRKVSLDVKNGFDNLDKDDKPTPPKP